MSGRRSRGRRGLCLCHLAVRPTSGYLTIHAERSDQTEGKHHSEFWYGSSSRTLPLPALADENAVTASYRDGILTISVGLKVEKKAPAKKIQVTSGS